MMLDTDAFVERRTRAHFDADALALNVRTDRTFSWLLAGQWIGGIAMALVISPHTWIGARSSVHLHVLAAVLLGGLISLGPIAVARVAPGSVASRHAIALGQSLTSALLIHLSGGRIETHFHVFGSLAFLAFYRDWKVLMTASTVVAVDHLVRGLFWPQSVFGVLTTSKWRWLEHAGWVVFEDVFLILSCLRGRAEMLVIAERRARLEAMNYTIEEQVRERTVDLESANAKLWAEVHERKNAERERDEVQAMLSQAQKLESIGQLAAGIAHEINTPTQYVADNTRFLRSSFADLLTVVTKYRELLDPSAGALSWEERRSTVDALRSELDLEFLQDEVPKALEQSLEGLDRVTTIVRAMKDFSHPGGEGKEACDLNEAVTNTATVARSEWKYVAELDMDLDPELPPVPCHVGEVKQVVLNLIVNAAHAIREKLGDTDEKGRIEVSTRLEGDRVAVRVRDTGGGVPERIRGRIFDPFFTTKEIGKGTGQGLSIAHAVVVKKHGGALELESSSDAGSTFLVRLPLVASEIGEAPRPEEAVHSAA